MTSINTTIIAIQMRNINASLLYFIDISLILKKQRRRVKYSINRLTHKFTLARINSHVRNDNTPP